jgi:hypothetical protein
MSREDDDFETTDVKLGSNVVTLGTELGSGKEGTVYGIQHTGDLAVKIFERKRRGDKVDKITEMVRSPPEDPTIDQLDQPALIWPIETVSSVSDDAFLGYSMPRLEVSEFQNAQKYARNALCHSNSDADFRYLSATDLALKVALVHVNGHALGDMHHSNILVNGGIASLIDCDGFHITGKYQDFGGATVYPRYKPPDTRNETDDVETVRLSDQFGLAIHIFQFLMAGYHPFVAVGSEATTGSTKNAILGNDFPYSDPDPGHLEPPARAPEYDWISPEIKDLFDAAFVFGKTNPEFRPTAKDWVNALARASSIDTSGSDPVRPTANTQTNENTDSNSTVDRQEKWERQRKQRQKQVSSSGSDRASGEQPSASSDNTSSGETTGGKSYSRDSSTWVEEIRAESSADRSANGSLNSRTAGSSSSAMSTSTATTGAISNSAGGSAGATSPSTSSPSSTADTDDSESGLIQIIMAFLIGALLAGVAYGLVFVSSLVF